MKRFIVFAFSFVVLTLIIGNNQVAHAENLKTKGVQSQANRDILDSSFFRPPYFLPLKSPIVLPITVMNQGAKVPFETVLNAPSWRRPAYRHYWDSSVSGGRWSHLPTRVHYALHRVFASPMNASAYYDFVHNVGIVDEMTGVQIHQTNVFEKVIFVVMQADVKNIYRMGNQLVITTEPKSTGLHVFTIKTSDIPSIYSKEPTLVQLVTQDSQPIDHWMLGNLG